MATLVELPTIEAAAPNLAPIEAHPTPATQELEACLNRVEFYQPLYGISGFEAPLRQCRDRAVAIEASLAPLGRNIKLVDFGSSLGYFAFYFADRGATTFGYDIKADNTAVALATQKLNRLPATFGTAALDLETVRAIQPGQYDVAMALSVLHHITNQRGIPYVTQLVAELLARVPTLILELAHRNEEVRFAWRNALPEHPLDILAGCGPVEVETLAHFPSHLSTALRPLYRITRAA